MNKIIDLFEKTPHIVQELICVKCLTRWIGVRPQGTLLKKLECPKCNNVGFVITTGEEFLEKNKEIL